MDPGQLFVDNRLVGICAYCGAQPDTRDHVPSKVLLDEPFPPNLPVVDACAECNISFSLDEQYCACFIECVVCGTTDPSRISRLNVKRCLNESPTLRGRIAASQRCSDSGELLWQPEVDRIRRLIIKLARGHAAYELYPQLDKPVEVDCFPLLTMTEQERTTFEGIEVGSVRGWPELGTRSFRRILYADSQSRQVNDWIIVQPERYRYAVVEANTGLSVKMVLSEYLACAVAWE